MRRLRQIAIVGLLSVRTLPSRIRSSWIIVAALTCVSTVLLSMLSADEGIRLAYSAVGHPDRAVVLSTGADRDFASAIPPSWVGQIVDAPGVRRNHDGAPLAEGEVSYFTGNLAKRPGGQPGATGLRGIGIRGLAMRPEMRIVDGRLYQPGTRELLVGVVAKRKFLGTELGDRIALVDGGQWTVVGHYATGSFIDGDLIGDPQALLAALHRANYSVALASLTSATAFDAFRNSIAQNPALAVTVERESDYWKRQFENLPIAPLIFIYTISLLLVAGAISGIMHTMHATVSSRAKEIAILRAVGFGGLPVATSVVLEAMFFACVGAVIGTGIDWLWCDGYAYNGAYGVFIARVTPHLLGVAVGWALVTACVGAIAPAAQEARLSVVDALGRA